MLQLEGRNLWTPLKNKRKKHMDTPEEEAKLMNRVIDLLHEISQSLSIAMDYDSNESDIKTALTEAFAKQLEINEYCKLYRFPPMLQLSIDGVNKRLESEALSKSLRYDVDIEQIKSDANNIYQSPYQESPSRDILEDTFERYRLIKKEVKSEAEQSWEDKFFDECINKLRMYHSKSNQEFIDSLIDQIEKLKDEPLLFDTKINKMVDQCKDKYRKICNNIPKNLLGKPKHSTSNALKSIRAIFKDAMPDEDSGTHRRLINQNDNTLSTLFLDYAKERKENEAQSTPNITNSSNY